MSSFKLALSEGFLGEGIAAVSLASLCGTRRELK
jgi:hypothetical protein